jgi:hypothetical protein
MTAPPKEAWFVQFGPVRDVDLVKVAALTSWRKYTGATYSHGRQLLNIENSFEQSEQVTSQIHPPRDGCTYWLRGTNKEKTQPSVMFIVRDGAIIAIHQVNRQEWEVMP